MKTEQFFYNLYLIDNDKFIPKVNPKINGQFNNKAVWIVTKEALL